MLVGKDSRRIAVQCMHRQPDALVSPMRVKEFLRSCKKADMRHAIIMTDTSFDLHCSYLKKSTKSVKLDLCNWKMVMNDMRKHLLGMG